MESILACSNPNSLIFPDRVAASGGRNSPLFHLEFKIVDFLLMNQYLFDSSNSEFVPHDFKVHPRPQQVRRVRRPISDHVKTGSALTLRPTPDQIKSGSARTRRPTLNEIKTGSAYTRIHGTGQIQASTPS